VRFLKSRFRFGAFVLVPAMACGGAFYSEFDGPVLPGAVRAAPMLFVPAKAEQVATARRELPSTLRVLVWNVYKGQREGWEKEFEPLAQASDLVLLQEAWLREGSSESCPMTQALCAHSKFAWQMVVSWVDEQGEGPSTGVATGAVAPPFDLTPLVSPATEPLIDTPKTALVTRYRLEGNDEQLLCVNVHALNVVGADTLQLQLDQLGTAMEAHTGPVLLAGDFNVWTDEKQERLRALVSRLSLTEVTFDDLDSKADARTRFFGNALDYAFVRGLKVDKASVHVTEGSDHNALLLTLAVR
jgi:endonuclease/exonuclease/phosphatase (EEP) superfamily protein YafD